MAERPPDACNMRQLHLGDYVQDRLGLAQMLHEASAPLLRSLHDESSLPASRRTRRLEYASLSAEAFEAAQATPLLLTGVPEHEGWPAAARWVSEASLVDGPGELGARLTLPITELFPALAAA